MYAREDIQDIRILTPMQESMLLYKKIAETDHNQAYFQQISFSLKGKVDRSVVQRTIDGMVGKYAALRTAILHEGVRKPVQLVLKKRDSKVIYQDYSHNPDWEETVKEFMASDQRRGFDLLKDPLLRLAILKVSEDRYTFVFSFHHIILDGWSLSNLLKEALSQYSALVTMNRFHPMPEVSFGKFTSWLEDKDKGASLDYWKDYLSGFNRKAGLPKRTTGKEDAPATYEKCICVIGMEKVSRLKEIGKRAGVSLSSIINTIWGIVLQKYNQTQDVVFAQVISGRDAGIQGIEDMVGMLINSIPVRVKASEEMTLGELINQVSRESLNSIDHGHLSLSEIQSHSELKNDLIETVLIFENYPYDPAQLKSHDPRLDFHIDDVRVIGHSNYDFNLTVYTGEEVKFSANYNVSKYEPEIIQHVMESIEEVVDALIAEIDTPVRDVDSVSEKQKALIRSYSHAPHQVSREDTAGSLFSRMVKKHGTRLAVVDHKQQLTFMELDERADRLCQHMRGAGFKHGDVAGVYTDRTVEMIVAIVAVLKAGGVYMPLNHYYSDKMLNEILEENQAQIVLHHGIVQPEFKEVACLATTQDERVLPYFSEYSVESKGTDLAYILYTSGTTGNPKGVGVEHRQLVNTIKGLEERIYRKHPAHLKVGVVAPYFFDSSIKQIFASLLLGHTLYLSSEESRFSGEKLMHFISENGIELMDGTPAHLKMLTANAEKREELPGSLIHLLVGGEKLHAEDVKNFIHHFDNRNLSVTNLYGLTESTVDNTTFTINRKTLKGLRDVPIGRPLINQSVVILDRNKRIVPLGAVGELYIGGQSVAAGYIHDPDLDKERYVTLEGEGNHRFYKTGDMGRWSGDGELHYTGRIDSQVKLRAYRVELSTIESCIQLYPSVREAVALKVSREGTDHLAAYFVSNDKVDAMHLRDFLMEKLPQYMVPSFYHELEYLPLTKNGKVDRGHLETLNQQTGREQEHALPENQIQVELMKIWKQVLNLETVGVDDHFFSIGGHSLKAMELLMMIGRTFNINIPFATFFKHPTIEQVSDYLERETNVTRHDPVMSAGEKPYYRTSSAQKRMYTFFRVDSESLIYNVVGAYSLEGRLHMPCLKQALTRLAERHEILRTTYEEREGEIVQKVHPCLPVSLSYREWSLPESRTLDEEVTSCIRPFNLNTEAGWELNVIRKGKGDYILVLNIHHINADGISVNILMEELFALYNDQSLPSTPLHYKDFSEWEEGNSERPHYKQAETYWLEAYQGELPVLDFPVDRGRPANPDYSGDWIDFRIGEETLLSLKRIVLQTETTLYAVLYGMFNFLLYKYTNQTDFITGTVSSGRSQLTLDRTIGMFVNTLGIRTEIDESTELEAFLVKQMEKIAEAMDHQHYPFEEIVAKKDLKVARNRNPLFDVLFSMNTYDGVNMTNNEMELKEYPVDYPYSKFDFSLTASEKRGGLEFRLVYRDQLFQRETMKRLADRYVRLLDDLAPMLHQKVGEINLIQKSEEETILHRFNQTGQISRYKETIHGLFENVCRQAPAKRALMYRGETWDYCSLNEKSNQLARILRDKGVGKGTIVAICMEQGFARIQSILAILKAGAAFLPIDESYPVERMEYMLRDSGAAFFLRESVLDVEISFTGMILDVSSLRLDGVDHRDLGHGVTPGDLAYIMYTSGSTGNPKGVMIEHKSVVRLVHEPNYIEFNESDKILQGSTVVFDASTLEIWGALLNGLELHLIDKQTLLDVDRLEKVLIDEGITILWMTAPFFNQMSRMNPRLFRGLRYLMIGGDTLAREPIERVRAACSNLKILNGYGPTENTTFSTTHLIEGDLSDNIPIGRPISRSTVYIMNNRLELQPIDVIGEICVGGEGVSRGYVNQEKVDQDRFVDHPYAPGERLYRTGDRGRWLSDGSVEYWGRNDQQVKVRGYRIELGEIESALLQQRQIKEAVVLPSFERENDSLTAYVVTESDDSPNVWENLKLRLPEYMHPSAVINVEHIPLTPNGKIDKDELKKISSQQRIEAIRIPETETENMLMHVWKETFPSVTISVDDTFYALGGNSLTAIELLARIRKQFSIEMSLNDLFVESSIRNIGRKIDQNSDRSAAVPIPQAPVKEWYAVTMAQEKLYALFKMEPDNLTYNMPTAFSIKGPLNIGLLKTCFGKLIERHASLRTSFHAKRDRVVQKVHHSTVLEFEYVTLGDEDLDTVLIDSIQPFRLSRPSLLRVKAIKTQEEQFTLFIDMHHIISDGQSLNCLLEELFTLYRNGGEDTLKPIEIEYRDYAEWQKGLYKDEEMKRKEQYWVEQFSPLPEFSLPYDHVKKKSQSFEGRIVEIGLGKEFRKRMTSEAKRNAYTPNAFLLAAYHVLLFKFTKQVESVIGTSVSGRKFNELSNSIGMYARTVPLRIKADGSYAFSEVLEEVQKKLYEAIDFQEYETENLLEKIQGNRSEGRLFDTVFTFEERNGSFPLIDGVNISKSILPFHFTKFDLIFSVLDDGGEFTLQVQYNPERFEDATIQRMAGYYQHLVTCLLDDKGIGLNEVALISVEERNRLVTSFNDTGRTFKHPEWSLLDFFKQAVIDHPDKEAVVSSVKSLTYRELDLESDDLAWNIQHQGVKEGQIVGILLEPGPGMIVSMLAVMKAGAAFMPLDPAVPLKRLNFMLRDSGAKMLISTVDLIGDIQWEGSFLLYEEGQTHGRSIHGQLPSSLAYVIYTSGTTGRPKGVKVGHEALLNLCHWHNERFSITSEDRATKYAGVGFDASVWETFPYLMKGSAVHIVDDEIKLDMDELNAYFDNHHITIGFLPTQICEEFILRPNRSLRFLLTGGDRLKHAVPTRYALINNYGPTENTVVTTSHEVKESDRTIPIGKPIANTNVYILDQADQVQPIGVPGELCVSGAGVAMGYINQTGLNKEKFTRDPFNEGLTMYRTGDLVKWTDDGSILYLGRVDNQVKVRGNRVEVAEIETMLMRHGDVRTAVVLKDPQGGDHLVAYVCAVEGLESGHLKQYLKADLPSYMIPTHFHFIDEMPLTSNGKVDKARLSAIPLVEPIHENESLPMTEMEKAISASWAAVLGFEPKSAEDDFFESGGDSLKAVYLLGEIRETLKLQVKMSDIFTFRTIRDLAVEMANREQVEPLPGRPASQGGSGSGILPLGPSQKRLFILEYFNRQNTQYNMPLAFRISGKLNTERLEAAFVTLIERHEVLRSSFSLLNEEPVQQIRSRVPFTLDILEWDGDKERSFLHSLIQPFDLTSSPLLRAAVIKRSEHGSILFIDQHHIISDGVSVGILLDELIAIYQGRELPEANSYSDYLRWQASHASSKEVVLQKEYWKKILNGYKDDGEIIPLDYPRTERKDQESQNLHFSFGEELTSKTTALAHKLACTPAVLLSSIYAVLLHKYSNRSDLIIGCAVAGRQHPQTKGMLGMFTNTLPIRYKVSQEVGFEDFVSEVNRVMIDAFDHQDLQFDDIIHSLDLERQAGKPPLISTLFQYQSIQEPSRNGDFTLENLEMGTSSAKFDVEVFTQMVDQVLEFSINYQTRLFEESTIRILAEDFRYLAEQIVEQPLKSVKDLELSGNVPVKKQTRNLFDIPSFNF
ncbi:amino acid adenylation domain-containing protein [Rossellomorea marisflavi]|uniref:non-ribosomal peptide synthetase n=1 Tax=Rossellomorea marisflavi TaxID=189381 RepID=UPI00345B3B77